MNPLTTLAGRLGVVLLVQLGLVGAAVAPQLSARVTGEEYLLRVAPVDPIAPFRGAYVDLDYPGLPQNPECDDDERGTFYVTLVAGGDDVWDFGDASRSRPDDGPYLQCNDRDYRVRCGIESYFLPQDAARELEQTVASGEAVARVRIDGRGHAALLDVGKGLGASPRRPPG